MTLQWSIAKKTAVGMAVGGNAFGIVMPFLSLTGCPHHLVSPMLHAILLFFLGILVFAVGVPASIVSIRQGSGLLGWLTLCGCVGMWPIGVAMIYVAGFLLGIQVNTGL